MTQNIHFLKTTKDIDFKNWQLPLGRDVKSLKLWFIIQQLGVKGIHHFLRQHIDAGKYMEKLLIEDGRFEVVVKRDYGLVVFRAKGDDSITDKILKRLSADSNILIHGSKVEGKSIIRFSPAVLYDDFSNVLDAFNLIKDYLD